MKTVFLRELLLAFRRIATYVTIGVSALVTALFFITSNLTYASPTIASTVSFAQLVSAVAVPMLAFIVFAPSKKADTDAFYDMLPIRGAEIFFGKYLCALALFGVSMLPMFFYPVIAGAFGAVDHAQCYLLILVYALSEVAFLTICAAVCMATRRFARGVSIALCYVLGVALMFVGIANVVIPVKPVVSLVMFAVLALIVGVIVFLVTKKIVLSAITFAALEAIVFALYFAIPDIFVCGFERFLDATSIFDRLGAFTTGLFDATAFAFYACAISAILFLAYRVFAKKRAKNFVRSTLFTAASIVVVIAMVLVNVALYFLPYNVTMSDMTLTHRNSVGEKAQRYLSTVNEPVTIYLLEPTGAVDYEMYLESVAACSPYITLEKVYYENTPEFYTDRGISFDYANSLYVESQRRGDYLSYVNLFSYTNETLGLTDMSISDYQYYYSMFSSNSSYAEYLAVLAYNTVENYNADSMICGIVEYAVKEIIPKSYYLTGHGERELEANDGAFAGLGFTACTLENGVPADAASLLINAPTVDITEAEKQALLGFLARGGEITFITSPENISMPNLMAVLAEYGMSATEDIVSVTKPKDSTQNTEETQETEKTSEFNPTINTQSDIMYLFSDPKYTFSVKDTNNITYDKSVKPSLMITPLLIARDGDTTYTVACSAETAAGARIAWFTGAESYNDIKNLARFCPIAASTWTQIKYESDVSGIPSVVYNPLSTPITDNDAVAVSAALIVLPIAFVAVGCVMIIRRRRVKAA